MYQLTFCGIMSSLSVITFVCLFVSQSHINLLAFISKQCACSCYTIGLAPIMHTRHMHGVKEKSKNSFTLQLFTVQCSLTFSVKTHNKVHDFEIWFCKERDTPTQPPLQLETLCLIMCKFFLSLVSPLNTLVQNFKFL